MVHSEEAYKNAIEATEILFGKGTTEQLASIDEKSLLQAVDTAVSLNRDGQHGIPVPDYIDENVSTKVVKIIQSYTGIVNRMVWRKS
jgi:UDP-N-acetylglucosamine 2-epimerase